MCIAKEISQNVNVGNLDEILTQSKDIKEQLIKKLSNLDLASQDILHYLEFNDLNCYKIYQIAKDLQLIRRKRREIKNELETIDILVIRLEGIVNLENKISNRMVTQKGRRYFKRILKDNYSVGDLLETI